MSMPLSEALEQVELQPGKNYSCRVKGLWVELRVREAVPELAARFEESDVMLDAWVELPRPEPLARISLKQVPPRLPDVPHIPADEEISG